MASTFVGGILPVSEQSLYVHFQTTWREHGAFTINFVIVDKHSRRPNTMTKSRPPPGKPFAEGGYRIGEFLAGGEKWWHLTDSGVARRLELGLPKFCNGSWTAPDYRDESGVIRAAVDDVTHDVRTTFDTLGIATASGV